MPGNTYDQRTGVHTLKNGHHVKCPAGGISAERAPEPHTTEACYKTLASVPNNQATLRNYVCSSQPPSAQKFLKSRLKKRGKHRLLHIQVDQIIPSHFSNVCTWLSRLLWTAANAFWFTRHHFICIMHRQHKLGVPGDHEKWNIIAESCYGDIAESRRTHPRDEYYKFHLHFIHNKKGLPPPPSFMLTTF